LKLQRSVDVGESIRGLFELVEAHSGEETRGVLPIIEGVLISTPQAAVGVVVVLVVRLDSHRT